MSVVTARESGAPPADKLVDVRGLKKYFVIRGGVIGRTVGFVRAVDGVDLAIPRGKTLGLIGESGCGKTTVGRCILRLLEPTAGSVFFDGRDLARIPRAAPITAAAVLLVASVVFNVLLLLVAILGRGFSQTAVVPDIFFLLTGALFPGTMGGVIAAFAPLGIGSSWFLLALLGVLAGGYAAGAALEGQRAAAAAVGAVLVMLSFQLILGGAALLLIVLARKEFGKDTARVMRKDMQIVFQDPFGSLNPRMLVSRTIAEPLAAFRTEAVDRYPDVAGGGRRLTDAHIARISRELLARVGLNPEHMNRFPHEFSGGQRQRICVARALALKPAFIVLDEPTSALDVSVQAQILNLLRDLQRERALTYLFISHHLAVIRHMCDDVAVMYLGKVVEHAPNDVLFAAPRHPYTLALMSAIPSVDPETRRERIILEGEIPSIANPPPGCRFHTRCNFAMEREVREVDGVWDPEGAPVVQLRDPLAAAPTVRLVRDGAVVDPFATVGSVGYEGEEVEGAGVDVRVIAGVKRGENVRVRYRRYRGPCVLEEPQLLEVAQGHAVACHFSEEALSAQQEAARQKRAVGAVIAEMRAPLPPPAA